MVNQRLKRHVKIVCTLGPASTSARIIKKMLQAGMNIARLNLAYGTPAEHQRTIACIRALSRQLNLPTAVLLDLPGRKRRRGETKAVFGEQLEFARSQEVDFIALSYISSAGEVAEVRKLLEEMDYHIPVIVKIEKAGALRASDAILQLADGIMVARGDLAIQISIEKVPLAQKRLIRAANQMGKPVITATQMLESMVRSPAPTRAEATDVANAVLDGTDAVMLSEETAIGEYPAEAVAMMARIVLEAETAFPYGQRLAQAQNIPPEVNDATAKAACQIAHQVGARTIVAFTASGATALRVSKYRAAPPVLGVTPSGAVLRRLSLLWGVHPVLKSNPPDLEAVFELASQVAVENGAAKKGDLIVLTAGLPLMVSGSTNLLKVHTVP